MSRLFFLCELILICPSSTYILSMCLNGTLCRWWDVNIQELDTLSSFVVIVMTRRLLLCLCVAVCDRKMYRRGRSCIPCGSSCQYRCDNNYGCRSARGQLSLKSGPDSSSPIGRIHCQQPRSFRYFHLNDKP